MRTPNGWRVDVIELTVGGRTRQLIRICRPNGIHIGDFATAEAAMGALYEAGVDPADLLDYVGR